MTTPSQSFHIDEHGVESLRRSARVMGLDRLEIVWREGDSVPTMVVPAGGDYVKLS